MINDPENKPPISLRDLFNLGGGIVTGFAANALLNHLSPHIQGIEAGNPTDEVTPIYTSGEIIPNPVTPIRVEGWRVVLDASALREYVLANPLTPVRFTVNGKSNFFNLDNQEMLTYNDESAAESTIIVIPFEDTPVFVMFEQSELAGEVTRREIYAIRPKSYDYTATYMRDGLEMNGVPIVSERELPESAITQIQQVSLAFAPFLLYGTKAYIYKGVVSGDFTEIRDGAYTLGVNAASMTDFPFTHERFASEGALQLWHELAHAVFADMTNYSYDYQGVIRFLQSRIDLVKGAGFQYPTDFVGLMGADPAAENSPLFSIFDESSYVPVPKTTGVEYGHPYENETELFASGLSVLRFYPQAFIDRFSALTEIQKEPVHEVVMSLLDALERYDSKESVRTLLPDVDTIQAALQK